MLPPDAGMLHHALASLRKTAQPCEGERVAVRETSESRHTQEGLATAPHSAVEHEGQTMMAREEGLRLAEETPARGHQCQADVPPCSISLLCHGTPQQTCTAPIIGSSVSPSARSSKQVSGTIAIPSAHKLQRG
eukprot:3674309-Pyramimonas_sp.AAC.1